VKRFDDVAELRQWIREGVPPVIDSGSGDTATNAGVAGVSRGRTGPEFVAPLYGRVPFVTLWWNIMVTNWQ
jgi:hypothetical protein